MQPFHGNRRSVCVTVASSKESEAIDDKIQPPPKRVHRPKPLTFRSKALGRDLHSGATILEYWFHIGSEIGSLFGDERGSWPIFEDRRQTRAMIMMSRFTDPGGASISTLGRLKQHPVGPTSTSPRAPSEGNRSTRVGRALGCSSSISFAQNDY